MRKKETFNRQEAGKCTGGEGSGQEENRENVSEVEKVVSQEEEKNILEN